MTPKGAQGLDMPLENSYTKHGAVIFAAMLCMMYLCLVSWLKFQNEDLPSLYNDSYQYLSVAKNAANGLIGYTSIVHFDAEQSFGTIPAPMVTFPIGYPLTIAALSKTGFSLTSAALLANLVSAALIIWTIAHASLRLRLSSAIIFAELILLGLNSYIARCATSVSTEATFTALVTFGIMLLVIPPDKDQTNSSKRAALAGLLIGIAYHFRYAALFILVGLVSMLILSTLTRNKRLRSNYLVCILTSLPLMIFGLLRNYLLVGNWRGGNEKFASHPFIDIVINTITSADNLILGKRTSFFLNGAHATFYLLAISYVAILIYRRGIKNSPGAMIDLRITAPGLQISIIVLSYCLCMFYAGLTTVISYSARMFLPILPLTIFAIASETQAALESHRPNDRSLSREAISILTLLLVLYTATNMAPTTQMGKTRISTIKESFHNLHDNDMSAPDAIANMAINHQAIIANDGQVVGHVLNTKTISLVSNHYSSKTWDESQLLKTSAQYNAGHIVIIKPDSSQITDPDIIPSKFIGDLATLRYPNWLSPAFDSSQLVIYRIQDNYSDPTQ